MRFWLRLTFAYFCSYLHVLDVFRCFVSCQLALAFCHLFDACLRRRSPERLWAVRAFAGIARGEGGDGFQRGLKCTAHIGNVRVESW